MKNDKHIYAFKLKEIDVMTTVWMAFNRKYTDHYYTICNDGNR